MRKNVLRTLVLTGIALLAMGGVAAAIVLRAGPIEVTAEGGFAPTTLPKHETAPITIHGEGKIGTTDGTLPKILKTLTVWYDKHGAVVTKASRTARKGSWRRRPRRPRARSARARSSARAAGPR